jgi:hypothetical protein
MVEHARKEMVEQKRKFESSGQFSSNSRPRFTPPQRTPFHTRGQNVNYGQNQYQRPNQQGQQQQAQHVVQSVQHPNFPQNRRGTLPEHLRGIMPLLPSVVILASNMVRWDTMLMVVPRGMSRILKASSTTAGNVCPSDGPSNFRRLHCRP